MLTSSSEKIHEMRVCRRCPHTRVVHRAAHREVIEILVATALHPATLCNASSKEQPIPLEALQHVLVFHLGGHSL
jgi:hypothetical protein